MCQQGDCGLASIKMTENLRAQGVEEGSQCCSFVSELCLGVGVKDGFSMPWIYKAS